MVYLNKENKGSNTLIYMAYLINDKKIYLKYNMVYLDKENIPFLCVSICNFVHLQQLQKKKKNENTIKQSAQFLQPPRWKSGQARSACHDISAAIKKKRKWHANKHYNGQLKLEPTLINYNNDQMNGMSI